MTVGRFLNQLVDNDRSVGPKSTAKLFPDLARTHRNACSQFTLTFKYPREIHERCCAIYPWISLARTLAIYVILQNIWDKFYDNFFVEFRCIIFLKYIYYLKQFLLNYLQIMCRIFSLRIYIQKCLFSLKFSILMEKLSISFNCVIQLYIIFIFLVYASLRKSGALLK